MPAWLLLSNVKRGEFVSIRLRVVTLDFENFGHETLAGTAFQLDDDVQGVGNIAFDRVVGELDATLQDATGKARQALLCGRGVDGGKRARVPGIEQLQEVEC